MAEIPKSGKEEAEKPPAEIPPQLNTDKLNTKEEQAEINRIIKSYKDAGKYLGESLYYTALYRGYAIHNAGLLPAQKELVEELYESFEEEDIKDVFEEYMEDDDDEDED